MEIDYKRLFDNHTCNLCGFVSKNRRSMGNHLRRSHEEWTIKKYILHFYLDDKVPECACGCGQSVAWKSNTYSFAEYVSGHNNKWSSSKQPKLSKETIEKRNNSIKKTYEERGEEIKVKISKSVKEALSSKGWKREQSQKAKKRWECSKYRKRLSDAHKSSWRKSYKTRYEKTFTSQMRKKISYSNMNRSVKRVSGREKIFFDEMSKKLKTLVRSKWVPFENCSKCYDIFYKEHEMLIELDGIYWHGLDRNESFTFKQVQNIANDFVKNRIAIEKGFSLLRISMTDENLQKIKAMTCVEDLVNISRYAQIKGNIIKDEMFSFDHDNHILVSRDYIIRSNDEKHGHGKDVTEKTLLPETVNAIHELLKRDGWFYPSCNENIDDVIKKISECNNGVNGNTVRTRSNHGSTFLKSRMKSFWHAANGPALSCMNKDVLKNVISYRLGLNNSKKYKYKLTSGEEFECNETFDITPRNIRNGFLAQRRTVSWFPPTVAKDIWKYVLKDFEGDNPKVWDPSGGFGARMLGFVSVYPKGHYTCNEPANMTYDDLVSLKVELMNSNSFYGEIDIIKCGSEIGRIHPENYYDAIMTSPPYFDRERYFDEPGQCWRDYETFDSWIEFYLRPTIENAFISLKKGSLFALNVSADLRQMVIDESDRIGFEFVNDIIFKRARDHFSKKHKEAPHIKEHVLVFRKQ